MPVNSPSLNYIFFSQPGIAAVFGCWSLLSIFSTSTNSFLDGTRNNLLVWSMASMEAYLPTHSPSGGAEVCGRVGCVEVFVALFGWPEAGDSFF